MRADTLPAVLVAAAAAAAAASSRAATAHAFQSSSIRHHHRPRSRPRPRRHHRRATVTTASSSPWSSPTSLPSGKGFGESENKKKKKKKRKYSIADKSYGIAKDSSSSSEEEDRKTSEEGGGGGERGGDGSTGARAPSSLESSETTTTTTTTTTMAEFFARYYDWKPLFRDVMTSSAPAASFLLVVGGEEEQEEQEQQVEEEEGLWGMSTLEHKNPWRLLPSKPTSDSSLSALSAFLDEWQRSLLDIPLDSIITGDNDAHFLEEGRRTIAVTRFHVLEEEQEGSGDGGGDGWDWEEELFRTCWSEAAHLASKDEEGTGSLVLLPDAVLDAEEEKEEGGSTSGISLERARDFVERNLLRPMRWLGRDEDWEIVAMERGSVAVRMLYKLGDIPDLSERDGGADEDL